MMKGKKISWAWVVITILIVVIVALVIFGLVSFGPQFWRIIFPSESVAATVLPSTTQLPVPPVPATVTLQPATAVPTATPVPATATTIPATATQVSTAALIPSQSEAPSGGQLFQSPVEKTATFNEDSAWIIADPGVILDNTAVWTIPSTNESWYANVPEGGFTYFSMGQGKIIINGFTIGLPYEKGNNYLVLIRGKINDNIVDSDLNRTAEVVDFVPGHAIWSIMPPGAYVSKNWFYDQMVISSTTGGTNCGATGCSTIQVVLFDIDSRTYQVFVIKAGALDNWTLVK